MSLLATDQSIGVIYAPFQVASINELHKQVVDEQIQSRKHCVIALPVRKITPAKSAPLDFPMRALMIQEYFGVGKVSVVPVVDRKYPKDQVTALESAVSALFSGPQKFALIADPIFNEIYVGNGGKWPVLHTPAFLSQERKLRLGYPTLATNVNEAFRQGVICGLKNQFPISWSTVDIAIRRVVMLDREAPPHHKIMYLFGRKPGEFGWRFPGGFKDREDPDYETAVWREAGEEVLKKGVDPKKSLTKPVNIGSKNIDDWRYRGDPDGITTLFYQTEFIGDENDILAGDDLGETKWFELNHFNGDLFGADHLEGEHANLYKMLLEFENRFNKGEGK